MRRLFSSGLLFCCAVVSVLSPFQLKVFLLQTNTALKPQQCWEKKFPLRAQGPSRKAFLCLVDLWPSYGHREGMLRILPRKEDFGPRKPCQARAVSLPEREAQPCSTPPDDASVAIQTTNIATLPQTLWEQNGTERCHIPCTQPRGLGDSGVKWPI